MIQHLIAARLHHSLLIVKSRINQIVQKIKCIVGRYYPNIETTNPTKLLQMNITHVIILPLLFELLLFGVVLLLYGCHCFNVGWLIELMRMLMRKWLCRFSKWPVHTGMRWRFLLLQVRRRHLLIPYDKQSA